MDRCTVPEGCLAHMYHWTGVPKGCLAHTYQWTGVPEGCLAHMYHWTGVPKGCLAHTYQWTVVPEGCLAHTYQWIGVPEGFWQNLLMWYHETPLVWLHFSVTTKVGMDFKKTTCSIFLLNFWSCLWRTCNAAWSGLKIFFIYIYMLCSSWTNILPFLIFYGNGIVNL